MRVQRNAGGPAEAQNPENVGHSEQRNAGGTAEAAIPENAGMRPRRICGNGQCESAALGCKDDWALVGRLR